MEAAATTTGASAIKHENFMSNQPSTTEAAILNTPSISSLEDDLGSLSSLPTFNMAPYARRPHRQDQFLSLEAVRDQESSDPSHALHSLPPTMAKVKLSSSQFPRYKRQYKVESIYVNDLYTLTYDEGETLESVKSVVVNYRRNDREEIRRKLAMGLDEDQTSDRPHRKPSLHSRLQSGMNLQICFMNETASDCESQCSDTESTQDREVDSEQVSTTSANSKAQLQQEARLALAQAKEMARMQMEIEKQSRKKSPIAEVVRASFNKIGVPFPDSKRRISRQILTDMNVAQLQVIVNDLHTQIESLNEDLVTFLMERDDLHMEQDSMLVDIEDLTKHIGAKELSLRGDGKDGSIKSLTVLTPPTKTKTNSMRLKGSSKK